VSRLAVSFLAIVLLVGCSGGAPRDVTVTVSSATAQAIVGKWDQKDGPLVVWFRPDGTFALDDHGNLEHPYAEGTYEVQRGRIHFASDPNGECGGAEWTWNGFAIETDLLAIGESSGGCGPSKVSFSTFERVD
jgi:hypothetical protein